jgi:hypothetical protein
MLEARTEKCQLRLLNMRWTGPPIRAGLVAVRYRGATEYPAASNRKLAFDQNHFGACEAPYH